ncbi:MULTISPECIES: universal stress protein [Stenotrophomonas]|uniref:Universal stress protein n=1 Tax=Stenotrophomonas maltophilia TaxID=40324 RepID=A0A4S2CZK4_STEMA|nr:MULTISPECIES: universal stress protein [Stenotrophomonas]MBD3826843.1 universal stress protein [Stenotrophomonas sp.]TGY34126.1 universal stress protein [Stenotrophomonas maltophilia]
MYCDILLPFVSGRLHEEALGLATALSRAQGSRLVALAGASVVAPVATGWMYYPAVYTALHEPAKETVRGLATTLEERLAGAGVEWTVCANERVWEGPVDQVLPQARCVDLTILGLHRDDPGIEDTLVSSLLVESGVPLLLVPPDACDAVPRHVVIAWKNTKEAIRAVHDALPLLIAAQRVHLLYIDSDPDDPSREDDAGLRLVTHLQRHGVAASPVHRGYEEGGAGPAILNFLKESGADCIVAGGYGRSRASEFLFGGVTRTLIRHSPIPVLLAH